MPMRELKIDKSFVRDLATDPDDVVLVRTAISLGHHHGALVVAEGVEDEGALGILASLGCDAAQGFLLSRPVPADQIGQACSAARAAVRSTLSEAVRVGLRPGAQGGPEVGSGPTPLPGQRSARS
jgi:EAL domain-containing protein (putative c-di-GMP-specific phosphodiesterase class I)